MLQKRIVASRHIRPAFCHRRGQFSTIFASCGALAKYACRLAGRVRVSGLTEIGLRGIGGLYADVAELVDAPDLGSGAERRGGSSPFIRTSIS